jgi:purine operon repressor
VDKPNCPVSVSDIAERLHAAKSSISEDVAMIRNVFESEHLGTIETIQGAQGGVRYRVQMPKDERAKFQASIAARLSERWRILPGGFLYMSDVLGEPDVLDSAGRLFAEAYAHSGANVVVTIETKGIPLAVATAHYLHVPVVIVRREHRVTEGATLSTHYVSGSERRIQTMSISTRAMPKQARALIVDDFMRAGATAKAVSNLLAEFDAQVVGTAVFMTTKEPQHKLVSDYLSLFTLAHLVEGQEVEVTPIFDTCLREDA